MTCDQVIAVLDANQGAIAGQAAFYVELTRARDNAVLLTDDRDGLVEALETAAGDELSALEAIGGQFREEEKTQVDVLPKPVLSDDALADVRRRTSGLEEMRALEPHLERCLAKRLRLEDAADGAPLSHVDGYAEWRERTTAALDIGCEVAGRIDWTETAETLRWLLVFDDDVQGLVEKLRRHVEEVGEPDEASLLRPDYTDLVRHAVFVESEAPAHARLPTDLADLIHQYETMTGKDALDLLFDDEPGEEESHVAADMEPPQSAEAPADTTAGDHSLRDDVAERLAAAIEERRALAAGAEGRLIPSLAAYGGWRKRAEAAVDAWQRLDGAKGNVADRDAARLGRAFDFDDRAVDLVARLEAHEAEARTAARDPQDGLDAALLALGCVSNSASRAMDGEPLPRALADFMERRDAWRAERKKQEAQSASEAEVEKAQPETTAPAPRPTATASPPPARKPAPEPAPESAPTVAPPPAQEPAAPAPGPAVRPTPPAEPAATPSLPAAPPPPPAPDPAMAARAIARALQERQRLQPGPEDQPLASLAAWVTWRREAQAAIADWKAGADNTADATTWRDAERLEALVAFDTEAGALAVTWRRHADNVLKTGGDPFGHPDAGRTLAAIKRLKDQAPQDAVLPQALARTLDEAAAHARLRERAETLLASVTALDRNRRVLLEREGSRDRPLNRRWNRGWKRWSKEAEALAPVIGELKGPTLARRLDGIEGARALVSRVEHTIAASEWWDMLPGSLLLRLHDNAIDADRRGVHATQTPAWKEIISAMAALARSLAADDPRWRMLWQETHAEDRRREVKAEVGRLAGEIGRLHRRARSLVKEAGKEGLALHQSAAYGHWYNHTRRWAREVRRVLGREGFYGELLADGTTTARDMAEAMAAFEEIRKAHGPPDDSVRMERRREERKQEQSRSRGRGFSM